MAEGKYSASEFSSASNTLIQDFINYGDELTSLKDINEKFFSGKPSAINSPVLGKNLFELWENNIEKDLGSFTEAYNNWITQLQAEGRVLEDFTRNQTDLFSKAGEAEDAFNNQLSDAQTITSGNPEQAMASSIVDVPGLSYEETQAWSGATSKDIQSVEKMFNRGINIDRITDSKQKLLYGVVGSKYVKDRSVELTDAGQASVAQELLDCLNSKDGNRVYFTKGEVDQMINDLQSQSFEGTGGK